MTGACDHDVIVETLGTRRAECRGIKLWPLGAI